MTEVTKEYDAANSPDYWVRNMGPEHPVITMATMRYPTYRWMMVQENPNTTFGDVMSLRDYRWYNDNMYEPVLLTEKPDSTHQHVSELQPVYHPEDDRWHQVWTTRPYTEEELTAIFENKRASKFSELSNAYYTKWNTGYEHVLNEGNPPAVLTLSGANLSKLTILHERSVTKPTEQVPVFFDTQNFVNMSSEEFATFYADIVDFCARIESEYIRLFAVIQNATNEEELPEIDQNLF